MANPSPTPGCWPSANPSGVPNRHCAPLPPGTTAQGKKSTQLEFLAHRRKHCPRRGIERTPMLPNQEAEHTIRDAVYHLVMGLFGLKMLSDSLFDLVNAVGRYGEEIFWNIPYQEIAPLLAVISFGIGWFTVYALEEAPRGRRARTKFLIAIAIFVAEFVVFPVAGFAFEASKPANPAILGMGFWVSGFGLRVATIKATDWWSRVRQAFHPQRGNP